MTPGLLEDTWPEEGCMHAAASDLLVVTALSMMATLEAG